MIATEGARFTIIGDGVLAQFGADGFQYVAKVPNEREVVQDGVIAQPPIMTVGQPATMAPPWPVLSPIRAAGLKPIITLLEPLTIGSEGPTGPHRHMSLTRAAGMKPISTVGSPGLVIGPPTCGIGGVPGMTMGQVCISVNRAAGGMGFFYYLYFYIVLLQ